MSFASFSAIMVAWAPALAVGVSSGLFASWLGQRAAAVPAEDRTYRDRPPWAMRLAWWPIQWIAHYLGPTLSVGSRQRILGRLRLGGLDYALSPEQFVASRLVAAGFACALAAWIAMSLRLPLSWPMVGLFGLFGYAFPAIWLRDRLQARRQLTLKTLPFFLDMLTLCAEAGLNLTGAMQQAVAKGPAGPLREEFNRVLRDVRAGRPRIEALRDLSARLDFTPVTSLVSALVQGEMMGSSLAPILRAQSEQRRTERFQRAEKLAMEAPVKMLGPLILCIFPCTFIVIAFPIVVKFLTLGL